MILAPRPNPSIVAIAPWRTAEDVERAFDLLGQYKDMLSREDEPPLSAERRRALQAIEEVLQQWLPLAQPTRNPLINSVCESIGNRREATSLLARADLGQERLTCLKQLAAAAFPKGMSPSKLVAGCRDAIEDWRDRLPRIMRRPDGARHVDEHDQLNARSTRLYWSTDLESRPSRLGASLVLAAACDAVVSVARRQGIARADTMEAISLARSLREHPDWADLDPSYAAGVVDKQIELARRVEELASDVDHGPTVPPPSDIQDETGDQGADDSNSLEMDFSGTSEAAVTAIVGDVAKTRKKWPDLTPKKEQIKTGAGKTGGAGDRALKWSIRHKLITPDLRVTNAGCRFLADRT